MPGCGNRGVALFAALNGLIQASTSLGFGIVAILLHQCALYPVAPTLTYPPTIPPLINALIDSFYLQYFHSQDDCTANGVDVWQMINATKTHGDGVFVGYVSVNGFWLLCSLLLITIGVALKARWTFAVTSIAQMVVIGYDVALAIVFGLDGNNYTDFIEDPLIPWITKDTITINVVVMLLIATRFVGFFIINIIFLTLMANAFVRLGKPNDSNRKEKPKSAATKHGHHSMASVDDPSNGLRIAHGQWNPTYAPTARLPTVTMSSQSHQFHPYKYA